MDEGRREDARKMADRIRALASEWHRSEEGRACIKNIMKITKNLFTQRKIIRAETAGINLQQQALGSAAMRASLHGYRIYHHHQYIHHLNILLVLFLALVVEVKVYKFALSL